MVEALYTYTAILEPNVAPEITFDPRDAATDKTLGSSCLIPDDYIDPRRSALFMARSILREVRDGRQVC